MASYRLTHGHQLFQETGRARDEGSREDETLKKGIALAIALLIGPITSWQCSQSLLQITKINATESD